MNGSISERELKEHMEKFSLKNAKHILKNKGNIPVLRYSVEHIDTVGNHALAILKMFELTQDNDVIRKGMRFLEASSQNNGKAYCWGFSKNVLDVPPDADDTAISLLVFLLARKLKLRVSQKFLDRENFKQFDSLVAEGNGIYTYFGLKKNNDVDPIVNTIVAFLLEFSGIKTKARTAIRKYLNDYFEKRKRIQSEYYKDKEYFLLRSAKLNLVFPKYFSLKAKKELKKQILATKPKTRMQKIFINTARIFIDSKAPFGIKAKDMIFPETLFFQRTPFYEYGSRLENQLFEAELRDLQKKRSRHFTLALKTN